MKNSLSLLNSLIKYAEATDRQEEAQRKKNGFSYSGESWLLHNLRLLEKTIKEESHADSRPS